MRRLSRAIAALATLAPLALALPAGADADPEAEPREPQAAGESPEPDPSEAGPEPSPSAESAEPVPAFEDPDPPGFSVIDPNAPPQPGEVPSAAEMEEKAKREAVGRQTEKLKDQSSHGVGQSYFGGGIF